MSSFKASNPESSRYFWFDCGRRFCAFAIFFILLLTEVKKLWKICNLKKLKCEGFRLKKLKHQHEWQSQTLANLLFPLRWSHAIHPPHVQTRINSRKSVAILFLYFFFVWTLFCNQRFSSRLVMRLHLHREEEERVFRGSNYFYEDLETSPLIYSQQRERSGKEIRAWVTRLRVQEILGTGGYRRKLSEIVPNFYRRRVGRTRERGIETSVSSALNSTSVFKDDGTLVVTTAWEKCSLCIFFGKKSIASLKEDRVTLLVISKNWMRPMIWNASKE